MKTLAIEFSRVTKAFFGVTVLKNVSFSVAEGSMLGIVGENGAGKSTLMNIVGGNLAADSGEIHISGRLVTRADPRAAERLGIALIHQELNLFPNLSVAENLFLTRFPRVRGIPWIKRRELNRESIELLREVGLNVPPDRLVETLSAGERQLLEVAKALSFDARIIIFDEPTTSLTSREIDQLFGLIGKLRARGITLVYISHVLADIFRLCDEILVLRDGALVEHGPASAFTNERLVSLMVGRKLDQVFPARTQLPSSEVLLAVRGLSDSRCLRDISFELHTGEVLGIAGLMGAGRSELARVLFGLDPHTTGTVHLEGQRITRFSPRALIRRGVAFLTENRRSEGLCVDAPVAENLLLAALPNFSTNRVGWISGNPLKAAVERIRAVVQLDRKTRDSQPVRTLSGGNQQKVVLGKWLLRDPRILILDEPTRGIDVGAKAEIYRLIHNLSARGVGILLISSEIEELIGLCDRILVMKSGRFIDELSRDQFDRERILRSALATAHPGERHA